MKGRGALIVGVVALVIGILGFKNFGQDIVRYWRIVRM